ncbi:helix-turn-helix transcriptional regulator [Streptomyces sp. NPDC005813]|uniref:helix-turn-helix domain-containing protein n=1 Tax=Streptomyces sp. NPDC005813 TaxID=3155592 RepID=UPI0033F1993A
MTQPPAPDWSTRLALSVAREVRRHRQAQGLSAQQLADRCAQIGMPIQRSVLANLESGRRTTVTIAEVLVLAHALNVPPGVLLFPVGYDQSAEVLPDSWIEPFVAVEWLAGRAFFSHDASDDFFDTPLGMTRIHQDAANNLRRAIQAKEQAMHEFSRLTVRHEKDQSTYDALQAESERVRGRLNEIARAAKNGEEYDFNESEQLSERHRMLVEQAEGVAEAAATLRYAEQRLTSAESRVSAAEASLNEIRQKIKGQGSVAPLLPRKLLYIDPESPAHEDWPAKRADSSDVAAQGVLVEADISASGEVTSGEQIDMIIAASGAEKERIRELLDELEPRLSETINEAVEEAFRRREQKEE